MSLDPEAIIEEAIEEFDLDDTLDNKVSLRDRTVTVYLDEVAGEDLGGVEQDGNGGVRRWGVLGEIDSLRADNKDGKHDERILELLDQAEPLAEKLKASGLTLSLHGVPPVIAKDTRRRARRALKIKGKNVPDDLVEEFIDRQQAELLTDCLVSVVNAKGQRMKAFDVNRAIKMKERLPASEYAKIDVAIGELQYKSAIAKSVTDNADFSQGI